jgi:hypothetical protein
MITAQPPQTGAQGEQVGGCAPSRQPSIQLHFSNVCNFLPTGLAGGSAALDTGPCAWLLLKMTLTNKRCNK